MSITRLPFFMALAGVEFYVDAIKIVAGGTVRQPLRASQLSADNSDFRLYELLKNDSRFFESLAKAACNGPACVSESAMS